MPEENRLGQGRVDVGKATLVLTRRPRKNAAAQHKDIREEVHKRLKPFADEITHRGFAAIVANWVNAPEFINRLVITAQRIQMQVLIKNRKQRIEGKDITVGDLWDLLNAGAPPHPIPARSENPTGMVTYVKGPYQPKTKSGIPPSFGGPGSRRGVLTSVPETDHPGHEGRHFPEYVYGKYIKPFNQAINNAYRAGFRKAEKSRGSQKA